MLEQIVHIIDDDSAELNAVKSLVESAGLKSKTYTDACDFLEVYDASAGCLVVDLHMPKMDGLELQKELKVKGSKLPVIFLTGYGEVCVAVEAMKAGAVDFIQKPYLERILLESVRSALHLNKKNRTSIKGSGTNEKMASLTVRENEVMEMLRKGKSNKEVARVLDISPRTVEVHRRNIMVKLNIKSVAELNGVMK